MYSTDLHKSKKMRILVEMKKLVLLWLSVMALTLNAQSKPQKKSVKIKYTETKEFKIDSVVLRRFYPGVMGAPIVYKVDFFCKAKRNLGSKVQKDFFKPDSIWMDGKRAKANLVLEKNANPLAKGREFQIFAELIYPTQNAEMQHFEVEPPEEIIPPKKYKGRMLLRYRISGKTYFVDVPQIQYGATIYAP